MIDFTTLMFVVSVVSVFFGGYQYRQRKRFEKDVNRRLVAYEGKLRDLGYGPERVYHDFENMLNDSPQERQAEEFESDVRYRDDG